VFKVNMVGATKTPAPGTLALLGLVGLIGYRRRAALQA
jgi:MYXO-CTERM domain-containing protein